MTFSYFVPFKEVTNHHFRVCTKDDSGFNGQRNNITVNYLALGGNSKRISQMLHFEINNLPLPIVQYINIVLIKTFELNVISRISDLQVLATDAVLANLKHSAFFSFVDINPCPNRSCDYFAHCVPLSSHQFTCVCNSSCPPYEEQVCASNGRTFRNLCMLRKEICETKANYTVYHPRSSTGISNT